MLATISHEFLKTTAVVAAVGIILAVGGCLFAQGALAQLGLSEAVARNFVLEEIKAPAQDRRSHIAIAGTRAFLKLPPAARGAAAAGLFAWAKAYANSPAFKSSYDSYRKSRIPPETQNMPSVDELARKEENDARAVLEEMRKNLATSGLSKAEQEKILGSWKEAEAQANNPEFLEGRRRAIEAERAEQSANLADLRERVEFETPADPQRLVARRLREFLEITADVNYSAETLSLTGGPDGIEFIDKADRQRHWIWQEAAIVGSVATAAARAAALAWLKEIEK